MKYRSFEEVPVWRDALELAVLIFELTSQSAFKGYYSVKDQLERAGVSISNNIAEGFERGTTQETLTFLYIAKGSSGEVRSLTYLLERLCAFATLRSENLRSEIPSCKHFPATSRLVHFIAERGYQGTTLPDG